MVLPLFDQNKCFIGSATLLDNKFLVTAAHCLHGETTIPTCINSEFFIRYEGEYIQLPVPLFEKYIPKAKTSKLCNEYSDISIFQAPNVLKSSKNSFKLKWPDPPLECDATVDLVGFCDDLNEPKVSSGKILNSQMAITNISENDSCMRTFNNCFRVSNFLCKGSSGGAIVHDNCCVGIIVFGMPLSSKSLGSTVALKASYIKSLLLC